MISPTYVTDTQAKSSDLASLILAATTPPQIVAACEAIESFLHKHTPDQTRWFFSITFPTLICKIYGFDESSAQRPPQAPNGWIDVVAASNDDDLASKVSKLLSPSSALMSSIFAADRLGLVKYVFPNERLPEWVRFMLQNGRDCSVLADLCPLFKGRIKGESSKGSSFQVQLNVFEYYIFWFAYYPVCRGNSEKCVAVSDGGSKKFRLENWTSPFSAFASSKNVPGKRMEYSLYTRLLYAYLRAFVPVSDLNAQQPYRSSLLHNPLGYDICIPHQADFIVNTLIHFWLVDNDFSPLPVNVCKSYGVSFPFRSLLGDMPPTSGLEDAVDLFVKYISLSSVSVAEVPEQVDYTGSPRWRLMGSADNGKMNNAISVSPTVNSNGCWISHIQRPLYRFILRSFLYCPMGTSIKNVSQVFSVWVSYIEPWLSSIEHFKELEADVSSSINTLPEVVSQVSEHGYSSPWQGFVLSNYLFYTSLVMHFIGFAHKFLHTDPEAILQMVSKIINLLTSSGDLTDLIKNVDTVFHSRPTGSSRSVLNSLYRFVPTIREKLQDWEDGLCESDADGSFLHENWNKDLRLFADGEDGGSQLLQLFLLRAESELQAISSNHLARNLECLDSLKNQVSSLFGGPFLKPVITPSEGRQPQESRNDIFKPRRDGNGGRLAADIKYKGDWMKRPISNDEIAWLAKVLVSLSSWLNEILGLNHHQDSSTSNLGTTYVEVSGDEEGTVSGPADTMKVLLYYVFTWFVSSCSAAVGLMKKHGFRVNLRMLASKKVVTMLVVVGLLSGLRKVLQKLTM